VSALSARDLTVAHQTASLLLGYPDEVLVARLPLLAEAATTLPPAVGGPLNGFVAWLATTDLAVAQASYVETFDLKRRCCLYLTYYSYGDTRKRGMALLRFTHAYKAAGLEPPAGELPDHLAVVLEFAALADPVQGMRLLREHRAGLELLRLALHDAGSPYADLLDAVSATLPDPSPRDREAVLRLAAEGPPAEEVGLEGYPVPDMTGARR
jgi:nitrate reductase delta subunit